MSEGDELMELKVNKDNYTNSNCITADKELLLNAVLNNRTDDILHLIETSKFDLIHHKYSNYGNKTILIIACINENVSADTLQALYGAIKSRYFCINCVDENWYKWEPIHHVAKAADPKKLKIFVENLDNVNSLTVFSENALHVLLEYEKSVKPFNTLLYNGPESRDCTIINTEKPNTVQCVKILIDAGIDINHSNFWNETPICIAARYRYRRVITLLLKCTSLDLDNYQEDGLKIRDYLKENLIHDVVLQSTFPHEDPIKILFNLLKSENEDAFLQFNNENIKDFANFIDGDSKQNTCGNMLQLCFRKGLFEYIQNDMYNEKLIEGDIKNNLMLTVFCTKGLGRCIKHLLNNGADPKLTYKKFPETLLEAAAVRGYYPLVVILLQHKTSPFTFEDIFYILPKLFEDKYNLKNYKFYRKQVLSLLLNKLLSIKGGQVLTSEELVILNEVLCHLNLEGDEEKEDDSENICQILKLGASLTTKIDKHRMVIECLHIDILKMHLDDCINNNIFCYNSFIEDNDNSYSETRALRVLIHDKKKISLLRHPLLIHFIHNKWLRIFYFYYLDLLLFTCFLLSIYAYMISVNAGSNNRLINAIFYILLIVHTVKEGFQSIYLYRLKYFLDTSNYLELSVIAACFVTMFYKNIYSMVIAILFSTVIFSLFLGQLPICAKYTIIFGSTRYFLQYASFYFMQFFSFALVFYIIFPFKAETEMHIDRNSNSSEIPPKIYDIFGGIFKSLFYTLIIFTGEFNDRVLEPEMFPIFGRLVMTIFIFCMTIILNNLLVGLIVADMDEMKKEGKLYKQMRTANFIVKANSLIKRLYDFKAHTCIEAVINFFHIFKKQENKVIDCTACNHVGVFDDEDKKYLKNLKSEKLVIYNKNILKELYAFLYNKENILK